MGRCEPWKAFRWAVVCTTLIIEDSTLRIHAVRPTAMSKPSHARLPHDELGPATLRRSQRGLTALIWLGILGHDVLAPHVARLATPAVVL